MVYPLTPFGDDFNTEILIKCQNSNGNNQGNVNDLNLNSILKWLCITPRITSYRVNTLLYKAEDIIPLIKEKLSSISANPPKIECHDLFPEVILIPSLCVATLDLSIKDKEVIIDANCATAVLRGAHIFAPGVIGMKADIKQGDSVSIYADVSKQCKKGFRKVYDNEKKVFIGNGTVEMSRYQLFGKDLNPSGVAVSVYSSISGCPFLGNDIFPEGSCMLQNLPSIVCTYVLAPQPGDCVLDMCASPGNKTTHIAALMKNVGTLIAIDKTPTKVNQLKTSCLKFGAKVNIFKADSTKIYDSNLVNCDVLNGPPFNRDIFDRILLDAPCSALGKRPQLLNNITTRVATSYIPLQRKLFETAVNLLKVGGILVYSTCTLTIGENEAIVCWALAKFKCLNLVKIEPYLGTPGWKGGGLNDYQRECVQRFAHDGGIDSVGFFIASFIKICSIYFGVLLMY